MASGITVWRIAVTVSALLCMARTEAGPTLEQAIARHRALTANVTGEASDFALLGAPGDGLTVALGGPDDDIPLLMAPAVRGRGGVRAVYTLLDGVEGPRFRLGLGWHERVPPDTVLEGTSLDVPFGSGALYASVETRHWGPGWTGSLILDAAAPALPAVGWRKTSATPFESRWFAWLGPWNADIFFGHLGDHAQPRHPLLIGMRLQMRPLAGLEVGLSRTIQWGGEGRDTSLSSLGRALLGRDNEDVGDNSTEPGNQLAGVDLRYGGLMFGSEWALYAQVIGEDEAGGLPSGLIAQAGAEWGTQWDGTSMRWFVEASNLVAGSVVGRPRPGKTYRHHIYQQGYTHRGLPLGHAAGGDVKLASVGVLIDRGTLSALVVAHHGRASEQAQLFAPDSVLAGLNASLSLAVGAQGRGGVSFWHWRAGSERSNALQAFWQMAWR
jgi:hypothetical protein